MDNDKKRTGKRIKEIRLNLGLTLEEFGKKIDPPANRSLVSAWENGRYTPNPERLKAIADIGNMTVNELLYGTPEIYIQDILYDNDQIDRYNIFAVRELFNRIDNEYGAKNIYNIESQKIVEMYNEIYNNRDFFVSDNESATVLAYIVGLYTKLKKISKNFENSSKHLGISDKDLQELDNSVDIIKDYLGQNKDFLEALENHIDNKEQE